MTTRRNVKTEKAYPEKDNDPVSILKPKGPSDTSPAVPSFVIYKLLAFTAAMVIAPISTYFITVNTVFGGSTTWAGASAALVANVVLVAYVIAAMKEDQDERSEAEARKGQ